MNSHKLTKESRFLTQTVDKLFHVFMVDMPVPVSHAGCVDYQNLLSVMKDRKALIIKASNYIHETHHYRQNFEARNQAEHHIRRSIAMLNDRRRLSQGQQLALSAWFCTCQGLNDIPSIIKDAQRAAKAKERAFLFNLIPLLANYVSRL